MLVQGVPPYNPTFQYSSPLKTLWRKGKLPSVKRGLYNGILTKRSVSLEHLDCFCYSHNSNLSNLALATKENNWKRGNKDIREFLTPELAKKYLKQFENISIDGFDGNKYIEMVKTTLSKLGVAC